MKCPKCKKDFERGVKTAYKLGLLDGEYHIKKTVNKVLRNNNVLLKANQRLTQEILRLDWLYPLQDTPSITIPWKKAKQLPKRLKKSPLKTYLINLIKEQLHNFPELADKSGV